MAKRGRSKKGGKVVKGPRTAHGVFKTSRRGKGRSKEHGWKAGAK